MTRRAEAHDYTRTGTLLVSPRIAKGEQEIIGEAITVPECKTMNCIAQALCRTKDDWWG